MALLSLVGCGKSGPSAAAAAAEAKTKGASSSAFENLPTGNWLEIKCNEGDVGPDLPPPPYLKGVIRFTDHAMKWSSRIFDDNHCKTQRPLSATETEVPYTVDPSVTTTDGSVPINVQVTDAQDGSTVAMFGLLKQQGGVLYFAMFPSAAARPTALDTELAQVFAPM